MRPMTGLRCVQVAHGRETMESSIIKNLPTTIKFRIIKCQSFLFEDVKIDDLIACIKHARESSSQWFAESMVTDECNKFIGSTFDMFVIARRYHVKCFNTIQFIKDTGQFIVPQIAFLGPTAFMAYHCESPIVRVRNEKMPIKPALELLNEKVSDCQTYYPQTECGAFYLASVDISKEFAESRMCYVNTHSYP